MFPVPSLLKKNLKSYLEFIHNMKLKTKVSIMVLILRVAHTLFGFQNIWLKREVSRSMALMSRISELAVEVSTLVHETQKERGVSAGFLESRGKNIVTNFIANGAGPMSAAFCCRRTWTGLIPRNMGQYFVTRVWMPCAVLINYKPIGYVLGTRRLCLPETQRQRPRYGEWGGRACL